MQFGQVRLHITPILLRKAFYHHLDHSVIINETKFDNLSFQEARNTEIGINTNIYCKV